MSRTSIPFSTHDISALARSLRDQLAKIDHTAGHLELLNMLARAAGHRNFQSLRAQACARFVLDHPRPAADPVDYVRMKRLAGYFDAEGRLASWPAKPTLQEQCLWVLWSKLPPGQPNTEAQINAHLRAQHSFGDHALLRRELCNHGLIERTADGREYRRVERRPSPDAIALIRHLASRPTVEPSRLRRAQ